MTDKTKAIIGADIHLCRHIWSGRPEIAGDAYNAYNQVIDYGIEHNVGTIALGGDIETTTKPSSNDVKVFREGIERAAHAGIRVVAIRGNHDWVEPPWFLSSTPLVEHVNEKTFDLIEGFPFYGIDYRRRSELPEAMGKIPKNVCGLLMHNGIQEAFGIDMGYEFCMDDIPKHIKWVFMGHIHLAWEKSNEHTTAVYTSSTYIEKKGAKQPPGFLEVYKVGDNLVYKRVPIKTRSIREFVINKTSDVEKLVEVAGSMDTVNGMRPLVFLDYDPVAASIGDITKAVGDKAFIFSQPFLRDTEDSVVDTVSEKDGVIECLNKSIDPSIPAHGILKDALTSGIDDKRVFFGAARERFGLEREVA